MTMTPEALARVLCMEFHRVFLVTDERWQQEGEHWLNVATAALAALTPAPTQGFCVDPVECPTPGGSFCGNAMCSPPPPEPVGELVEMLTTALARAHSCGTLRPDGTCDGCFVSATLARARGKGRP